MNMRILLVRSTALPRLYSRKLSTSRPPISFPPPVICIVFSHPVIPECCYRGSREPAMSPQYRPPSPKTLDPRLRGDDEPAKVKGNKSTTSNISRVCICTGKGFPTRRSARHLITFPPSVIPATLPPLRHPRVLLSGIQANTQGVNNRKKAIQALDPRSKDCGDDE